MACFNQEMVLHIDNFLFAAVVGMYCHEMWVNVSVTLWESIWGLLVDITGDLPGTPPPQSPDIWIQPASRDHDPARLYLPLRMFLHPKRAH